MRLAVKKRGGVQSIFPPPPFTFRLFPSVSICFHRLPSSCVATYIIIITFSIFVTRSFSRPAPEVGMHMKAKAPPPPDMYCVILCLFLAPP